MPPDVTKITKQSLMGRVPNWLLGSVLFTALVGFSDSAFLLAKHLAGGPIPCFITTGCDTVTNSAYSFILGIPVSALGVIFYLSVGFLTLLYWDTKNELFLKLFSATTVVGLLASTYFLYVQKFILKEYCTYCLLSAITSTTLFFLAVVVQKKLRG